MECAALHEVRNLNLWGNDIRDISVVGRAPNLEVLSLSVNRIETLSDLSSCTRLRELYLRKNNIKDLSEILYLTPLKHLRILWLSENPCCSTPNYREYILAKLPQLQKLDNTDITEEEREFAQKRSADFRGMSSGAEGVLSSPTRSHSFGAASPRASKEGQRSGAQNITSPRSPTRGHAANQHAKRALESPREFDPLPVSVFQNSRRGRSLSPPRAGSEDDAASFVSSPRRGGYGVEDASRGPLSPGKYSMRSPRPSSAGSGPLSPPSNNQQFSAWSSSNRGQVPPVPPLRFPDSAVAGFERGGGLPRSPVANSARGGAASQQPAAGSQSSRDRIAALEASAYADSETARKARALEEEIRLLRLAEVREREKELIAQGENSQTAHSRAVAIASFSAQTSPRRSERGDKEGEREGRLSMQALDSPSHQSRRAPDSPYSSRSNAGPSNNVVALSPRQAVLANNFVSGSASSARLHYNLPPYTQSQSQSSQQRPMTARPSAVTAAPSSSYSRQAQPQSRPATAFPVHSAGSAPQSPRVPAPAPAPVAATPLSPTRGYNMNGGGLTPRLSHGNVAPADTQHNLLCAAVAMIEEFDVKHLKWLQTYIDQRLQNKVVR